MNMRCTEQSLKHLGLHLFSYQNNNQGEKVKTKTKKQKRNKQKQIQKKKYFIKIWQEEFIISSPKKNS